MNILLNSKTKFEEVMPWHIKTEKQYKEKVTKKSRFVCSFTRFTSYLTLARTMSSAVVHRMLHHNTHHHHHSSSILRC